MPYCVQEKHYRKETHTYLGCLKKTHMFIILHFQISHKEQPSLHNVFQASQSYRFLPILRKKKGKEKKGKKRKVWHVLVQVKHKDEQKASVWLAVT